MTDLHILSDLVKYFWKCPKKGFKKIILLAFFYQIYKTQFKHLKYGMVVNWHKLCFCRYTEFFSVLKKGGLGGP